MREEVYKAGERRFIKQERGGGREGSYWSLQG